MQTLHHLRTTGDKMTTTPLLVSLEQAADELGVKRTTLFKLLRDGQLTGVCIGRRRLVPRSELESYVASLVAAAASNAA